MSAVHGDFDLFNGGLLKTEDRVLREIQSNQPPSIRNERHSLNNLKRRKPSQVSRASSSCSFFPIEAHQDLHGKLSRQLTGEDRKRKAVQLPPTPYSNNHSVTVPAPSSLVVSFGTDVEAEQTLVASSFSTNIDHAARVSLSPEPRVLKDISNLGDTHEESYDDSFEALAVSKRSNNVYPPLGRHVDIATLTSSSTTPPTTLSSSSDTFDKEVWDIVMEAKKAIHEQESNEPFNPQDHELLSSIDYDDVTLTSSPYEPSLPEQEGPLMATFDDSRPPVKVSIAFNKRQPSTLVATFNNGRPPMNVSITFDSTSRSNTSTSSIMSRALSDTPEATDEHVNISDKLQELKGKMKSRLNAAQMGNVLEALDVTSHIIRIKDGFCLDDLTSSQQMLVGYNQSAEPPSSVYDHPEEEHPVNVEYQLRTDTLKKVFKDANLKTLDGRDIEEILNLWSFPFGEIDPTTERVVFNLFHYETMQEHLGFRGKGKQRHSFRARHSTGDLISTTPAFVCSNLGLENFLQTINGDILPFAIYKDTKPTDMVSEETYFFMMKAYIHYLVRPAADDKRIVVAIGSKATCKTFAKFAYGGLSQLLAVYDMDPTQWISASDGKLEVNFHCEALYNILYSIYMRLKAETNDAFATNTRRVIDPNADPCTFAMEYFEEGSDIFELIQRNHKALCTLGGINCCKKRDESVLTYLLLLEEKLTPKEALEYIKAAFSVEHRNLVVGWMKVCKMIELAGRLQREEIDTDEVNEFASLVDMKVVDLMKNAEACMEGQGKFAIMSQLSAMLKRGFVWVQHAMNLDHLSLMILILFGKIYTTNVGQNIISSLLMREIGVMSSHDASQFKVFNVLRYLNQIVPYYQEKESSTHLFPFTMN